MMSWKKGRGKLGILAPLLGQWRVETKSDLGKVICTRNFSRVLDGKYVRLEANWQIGSDKSYDEISMIGVDKDKQIKFWSFTSDGKNSHGVLAEVRDLHPLAIGFEAQMEAGLARMAYWPDETAGFHWVVESKSKKGWNRFVAHHYLPML
ncbi:MAG: hypothetical protein OEX12_14745 [Gammaproteobacteria bacterium]|nr:hypothetical protein [Gammaproteobacteria bacterium]